jgi:HD superfamily phosphohydrolase YqeK
LLETDAMTATPQRWEHVLCAALMAVALAAQAGKTSTAKLLIAAAVGALAGAAAKRKKTST